MPKGFFVTDKGRAKIAAATVRDQKVSISKMAIGSGGDPNVDWDYSIESLKQEFYRKPFDSTTDKYMVNPDDPTEIMISAIVPNEVSGTINEIGYLDDENDLIVYGIVREKVKIKGERGADERIQYENWIKFDIDEIDNVVINILQGDYRELAAKIDNFLTEFEKLKAWLLQQLQNLKVRASDTEPEDKEDLMIWFDTQNRLIKYYSESEEKWKPFGAVYL